MNYTSITQRFVAWFLAISLLPLLLVGYSLLHTFETELQQTVARQIAAIADKKVDQIEAYLNGRVHDVLVKTQGNTTRLAMAEFARTFAQSGPESAAYRRLDARYRDYFKRFIGTAGYCDLFLISPQGTVVYSQTHEADFASNLFTGPYRNTGLAKVARNALNTLESGISEFELYAPSGNTIAAFIAVPIVIQGKVEGVLALQIDSARVFQVLLDETGMGVSGETVVARLEGERTALVMAPLKSDPDAALKRKITLGDQQRGVPLIRALNGERGSGYERDYLGKSVVAAWRYLPRMKWGMVVKMDTAEALAPFYRARTFGLVVVGLALVAALMGAFLLGRRVIVPLKILSNSAQVISAGHFDQRVPVAGQDELAYLAASFNIMAERLQSSYANLERQVKQRTAELTQSLANLRIKDAAIASSINAIAIAGLDGKLSYVNQAFVDLWRLERTEDALGRSPLEFVEKPEDVQAVIDTLQQGGQWQGEMSILRHDGSLATVQLLANMVMDEAGKPVCMMGSFVDITASKQMEQALRQERDFAAGLVNTAPVIVLLLDTEGVVEYVNPYFEQLTGYRLDEVRGKEWFRAFLPARDQDEIRALFQKAVQGEPTRGNINPIVTRSGKELEIEWYDQTLRDRQGKIVSVLSVGQDVTSRKAMERALSVSVKQMNEAQRIAQVGSWELDLLKDELVWSDEIFHLFEIDKSQFEIDKRRFGATYEAFLDAIHPDDRERVNQAYAHSLETRTPCEITHRLLMSDGRIKWVNERWESEFAADGKPLRSMGTVQDITWQVQVEESLRESEERLRLAIAASSQGLYDLNVQTGEAIVNAEYARMLGYELAEFHETNAAWIERLHPDDRDLVEAAYRDYVAGKIPDYRVEFRQRTRFGEWKWLLSIGKLVEWDEQGKPLRMLGVHLDISDRKRNEAAQLEARQAAEAASRAKSEFLANMSHEIRTPMNAILGLTQLVLDTKLTPRQQDFLKKAHASARVLLGILNDILDFSKIEAGYMSVEQLPFRLGETLEHVADLFDAQIEEKGLKLLFEVAPETPAEILGDPLRLTQVLTNLVSNAVKFTERGEIHIRVEVVERTPATQRLRFTVSDTGIGLSREQEQSLFHAFTQADGSTTRKYGGTGLGLAICKQLVELMGGEISASGVEGLGSAFVFTIQAGIAPPPGEAQPSAQAAGLSDTVESPQSLQGVRVLLVEDNALNRLMAAEFLKRRGLSITLAGHGGEAVERVKNETFDAVLMDLHMPIMDGLEATRLIRELPQGKSLPIIAMTAAVLQADRDRCAAAGMVDFIAKPIDPEEMIKALLKWVKTAGRASRSRIESSVEPAYGALPESLPGFDLEMALRRLDGNRDLLARLLLGFAGEWSGVLAQLDALLQAGENAQAATLLHTLKGVAANLGAAALAEATRQLEVDIQSGNTSDSRQGFADVLNASLDAIKAHIAPAQSAAGEAVFDREMLAQVLNRLVPYLQERELIPAEVMESLHSLARPDFPDKSLARLIRQIDYFDHDGALASLVQLAAIHGVTLESEH